MKKKEFLKLLDERLEGKTKEARAVDIIKDMITCKLANLQYAYVEIKKQEKINIKVPSYPEMDNDIRVELFSEAFEKVGAIRDYNRLANEINLLRDILNYI